MIPKHEMCPHNERCLTCNIRRCFQCEFDDRVFANHLCGLPTTGYATFLTDKAFAEMFFDTPFTPPQNPAKTVRAIMQETEAEADRIIASTSCVPGTATQPPPVAYRFRPEVTTTDMTYGHIKRLIESHRELLMTLNYIRNGLVHMRPALFNLDRITKVIVNGENATK